MIVLVCGDRHWSDLEYEFDVLDDIHEHYGITKIIEGCANGADRIAGWPCPDIIKKATINHQTIHAPDGWAKTRGIEVDHNPADWDKHGKAAGPIRNVVMLKKKPEMVVAFHKSLNTSKGTKHMVKIAREKGIYTVVFP